MCVMFMERFVSAVPIAAGWSADRKFCVTDTDGTKYLLRISSPEKEAYKRLEFQMMESVAALGIPMSRPVEFGVCEEGVYSLQSWIDGMDLSEALKPMGAETRYEYGVESGRILRRIQEAPVPPEENEESWDDYYNRKIDRRISAAVECPVKFRGQEDMIAYVKANRSLLKGRERTYQHGDYHVGNLMVDRQGRIQVIDFDRYEFGDPWEEFVRIKFDMEASADFAAGTIDGYFGRKNCVSQEVWKLLAFYLVSTEMSSPNWAWQSDAGAVQKSVQLAEGVYDWYDWKDGWISDPVPKWYREREWEWG